MIPPIGLGRTAGGERGADVLRWGAAIVGTDKRKVRLGFVGAGWWATVNHMPLLQARDDVELVAVCRRDPELLKKVADAFSFPVATTDLDELLALDLDGVVVSSPHSAHHEHAKAALERGMHVLCEKPMTLRPEEAWELVDLAAAKGLHLLVPYGWHYKPFVQEAKRWMAEGAVGRIEYALCHMASPTKDFFSGGGRVPSQWEATIAAPDPAPGRSRIWAAATPTARSPTPAGCSFG